MVTNEQITYLKQRVQIFNQAESLFKIDMKSLMAPHIYGIQISDYIAWMYDRALVKPDCYEIKNDFIANYKNDVWYKNLSHKQIIQCLGIIIRQDRFNDGLVLRHIQDGTFKKLINQLVYEPNG